jgi:UDPglucose--hexose-1-phosphate uridylyltransferase
VNEWREAPHRRYNPLTGEWVLVSPHRLDRPWQGESAVTPAPARAPYDPHCYLCPGNMRASGERNPDYEHVFVFENDYAALIPGVPSARIDEDGLLAARGESGRCRVLCFSPRHDLDIANMEVSAVRRVVDAWAQEYTRLGALPYVDAVTIFENRGTMMGASNPHPHGQIWANASVPSELGKETQALNEYAREHGRCLLCAYAAREIEQQERLVYVTDHVCVVVPFWAVWPFEVLVLPRRHVTAIDALQSEERDALAAALQDLTARYDRLFATPFPYSMGFHQRPTDGQPHEEWHMHAHYYPPLLRSASVRKYAVGYEMLAQPQRDFAPEDAAQRLRDA